MRTSTKLMALGLAGTGLLLTACEIPGSGPPVNTPSIVIEDPHADFTNVSSLPAILKGAHVLTAPIGEVTPLAFPPGAVDVYRVTVPEPGQWVRVRCTAGDVEVYFEAVEGGEGVSQPPCNLGEPASEPHFLAAGVYDIEVEATDFSPGIRPYVVNITVVSGPEAIDE